MVKMKIPSQEWEDKLLTHMHAQSLVFLLKLDGNL